MDGNNGEWCGSGPAVVVVRPTGELDMLTTPQLRSQLLAHLADLDHIVLDLSEVTFLSSSGLQVLVDIDIAARDRGTAVHVTGAGSRIISRPLEITGLAEILTISDVPADLLAARLRGHESHDGTTSRA